MDLTCRIEHRIQTCFFAGQQETIENEILGRHDLLRKMLALHNSDG